MFLGAATIRVWPLGSLLPVTLFGGLEARYVLSRHSCLAIFGALLRDCFLLGQVKGLVGLSQELLAAPCRSPLPPTCTRPCGL